MCLLMGRWVIVCVCMCVCVCVWCGCECAREKSVVCVCMCVCVAACMFLFVKYISICSYVSLVVWFVYVWRWAAVKMVVMMVALAVHCHHLTHY